MRRDALQGHGTLHDVAEIGGLIDGWIFRDTARWEELREIFHPDGTIEIGWFKGLFSDFVNASAKMHAGSAIRSRHTVAQPRLAIRNDRATAETNAILCGVNDKLRLGFTVYSRYLDLVERRGGVWKISMRSNVFDLAFFSYSGGPVEVDQRKLASHPAEYAPMAYVLEASGYPVTGEKAVRGSELEAGILQQGREWLGDR
jgi:hypothetical protein